ncbi:MAG: FeoC-like transcriptional regulator [Chlorobi bacterium]|nr:FeoC-like transcriptional regulator [Chlorobiota bacterium]
MTLSAIRDFLRERGPASVGDIARHFGSDTVMAETMIDEWIRRGMVEKKAADSFSHVCCGKCSAHRSDICHWIGA